MTTTTATKTNYEHAKDHITRAETIGDGLLSVAESNGISDEDPSVMTDTRDTAIEIANVYALLALADAIRDRP